MYVIRGQFFLISGPWSSYPVLSDCEEPWAFFKNRQTNQKQNWDSFKCLETNATRFSLFGSSVFLIRPPAPLASEAVANSSPSADECVRVGAYIRGFLFIKPLTPLNEAQFGRWFFPQIDTSILPFSCRHENGAQFVTK